MKMRFVGGPFAGQTAEIPFDKLKVQHRPPPNCFYDPWPAAELVWFIHGADKHCYQPVENKHLGDWRLIYRDTF